MIVKIDKSGVNKDMETNMHFYLSNPEQNKFETIKDHEQGKMEEQKH